MPFFGHTAHMPSLSKIFPNGKKENDHKRRIFWSTLAQGLDIFQFWGLFSNLQKSWGWQQVDERNV